jgi:hypothetical protein
MNAYTMEQIAQKISEKLQEEYPHVDLSMGVSTESENGAWMCLRMNILNASKNEVAEIMDEFAGRMERESGLADMARIRRVTPEMQTEQRNCAPCEYAIIIGRPTQVIPVAKKWQAQIDGRRHTLFAPTIDDARKKLAASWAHYEMLNNHAVSFAQALTHILLHAEVISCN